MSSEAPQDGAIQYSSVSKAQSLGKPCRSWRASLSCISSCRRCVGVCILPEAVVQHTRVRFEAGQ